MGSKVCRKQTLTALAKEDTLFGHIVAHDVFANALDTK